MDILIPLGTGSLFGNMELRIALRSIEKFATGYDRIFVIGANPGFLSDQVTMIEVQDAYNTEKQQHFNKEYRIAWKILYAFQHTAISDDVIFWNDDFVLNSHVDLRYTPNFHAGLALTEASDKYAQCAIYRSVLSATAAKLKAAGKPILHYDIHCPIIYNRARFLGLMEWWNFSATMVEGMCAKSVYANNFPVQDIRYLFDLKLRDYVSSEATEREIWGRWIYSYSDAALTKGLNIFLDRKFPKSSRFESGQ